MLTLKKTGSSNENGDGYRNGYTARPGSGRTAMMTSGPLSSIKHQSVESNSTESADSDV